MEEAREFAMQQDGTYLVDGDMLIEDVLMAFPKSAAIMLSYGLHCVGCHANMFDTIESGARGHGMPDEEIVKMIDEINAVINKRIETMEFTPLAISKIKELRLEETGKETWPLRIKVTNFENKFSYDLDFDKKASDDLHFEFDGLEILIDEESYALFKGSSIDYVETLSTSGFKIENPNAMPLIDNY